MAVGVARRVDDLQVACGPRKLPGLLPLQLDLTLAAPHSILVDTRYLLACLLSTYLCSPVPLKGSFWPKS